MRFSSEIKTPSCWKSSKRIFRTFPDLRVARRKKKNSKKNSGNYRVVSIIVSSRGGHAREGELSATRDVISANEIANRVNWRRDS